ncbi:MAG: O-antigen ligase family protein [Pseudomonadota bacterium]
MRNATLLVAIVFFVLSGAIEGLVARHISPDFQNRLTILFSLFCGAGLTAYAAHKAPKQLLSALLAGWPLLAFGALAIVSTLWSIIPQATILSGFALTLVILGTISTCALCDWRSMLRGIALACFALGVLSVILIPFGGLMVDMHEGALRGPFSEKNRAGMIYAIGAIACGGVAFTSRRIRWLLPIPFFIILLFLSQSGTSTISCIIGLGALAYGEILRGNPARLILGTWLGIIAGIGIFTLVTLNAETVLDLVGEDATFTGRNRIWPAVWSRVQDNLLFGYGYDTFWRGRNPDLDWLRYEVGFVVYNAHNGWLETMLAVGLPGVALLGWLVVRTGIAGLTGLYQINDPRRIAIPMISLIVMMSVTESAIGGPDGPSWLLMLLITTKAAMGEENSTPNTFSSLRKGIGLTRAKGNNLH